MDKCIGFFGLILLLGGLGCGIVSYGTSHWEDYDEVNGAVPHRGIFQSCTTTTDVNGDEDVNCKNLLESDTSRENLFDDTWFIVIVACHTVGVVFALIGSVLWLVTFCYPGSGIRITAIGLAFIAAGCFIASVVVWHFKFSEDGTTEGYSFWIAVGAAGGCGVAAILMLAAAIAHGRRNRKA